MESERFYIHFFENGRLVAIEDITNMPVQTELRELIEIQESLGREFKFVKGERKVELAPVQGILTGIALGATMWAMPLVFLFLQ